MQNDHKYTQLTKRVTKLLHGYKNQGKRTLNDEKVAQDD